MDSMLSVNNRINFILRMSISKNQSLFAVLTIFFYKMEAEHPAVLDSTVLERHHPDFSVKHSLRMPNTTLYRLKVNSLKDASLLNNARCCDVIIRSLPSGLVG